MKKPNVYEVNTRKRSYEVVGTSIEDVKIFVDSNRDIFNFDMSGYFKVEKTLLNFQLDVVFTDDNENIEYIDGETSIGKFNNMPFTDTIETVLVAENKKRIEKLISKIA